MTDMPGGARRCAISDSIAIRCTVICSCCHSACRLAHGTACAQREAGRERLSSAVSRAEGPTRPRVPMINQVSLAACMDLTGHALRWERCRSSRRAEGSVRLMQRNQGPAVSPSEAYNLDVDKCSDHGSVGVKDRGSCRNRPKAGIRKRAPRCPADHQRRSRCDMYSSATACQAGHTRTMPAMANFASSGA